MPVAVLTTIDDHTEATIDDLAPSYSTTIVQGHPCGTAEGIANDILHSHVGTELRTIVDVAGLTEWRVGARDIMMVTSKHHRT